MTELVADGDWAAALTRLVKDLQRAQRAARPRTGRPEPGAGAFALKSVVLAPTIGA